MSTIDELIQQGITQAKAGNKTEARKIFTQVVKQEPTTASAWWYLSQVVKNREQAIYCLEKVLQFQPENLKAAELLQKLKNQAQPSQPLPTQTIPVSQPIQNQPPQQVFVVREKKQNKLVSFLAAIGLLTVVCICIAVLTPSLSGVSGVLSKSHNVVLRVGGSASSAFITYNNAQGGTEQVEVYLPWEKEFTVKESVFLYVSAQNQDAYGDISCEIIVDGKTIKNSSSSGGYVIAMCDEWYFP